MKTVLSPRALAHLCLAAGVGRVLVDYDLVYLAKLAKVLRFFQHILQQHFKLEIAVQI